MSRNRTLWGSMLTLLMVIGFATPAFAQDAIDDAVAAVEDVTTDTTEDTAVEEESSDLLAEPQIDVPSPTMVLDSHEGGEEAWYDRIDFGGNFRYRNQWNYTSGGANSTAGNGVPLATFPGGGINRYRMRFRLLLDLKAELSDDVSLGLQLGTGFGGSSTNATIGTSGNGLAATIADFNLASINVRRAWGKIQFADGLVRAIFGLFSTNKGEADTLYRSILTFDSDISFGGLMITVAPMEQKDDANKVTQALYINLLANYLQDVGGGGNADNPILFAGTVDFRIADLRAGLGFWTVTHQDNWIAQYAPKDFGGPAFAALEVYVKYNLGALSVFAHAIYNTGGQRGFGALGGVSFKDGKGEGAIKADLIYYYQEIRAWPGNWSDADSGPGAVTGASFGGMSGSSGIELNAKYYITANVALGIEANFYYLVEDATAAADDNDFATTLIFDAYFDF